MHCLHFAKFCLLVSFCPPKILFGFSNLLSIILLMESRELIYIKHLYDQIGLDYTPYYLVILRAIQVSRTTLTVDHLHMMNQIKWKQKWKKQLMTCETCIGHGLVAWGLMPTGLDSSLLFSSAMCLMASFRKDYIGKLW